MGERRRARGKQSDPEGSREAAGAGAPKAGGLALSPEPLAGAAGNGMGRRVEPLSYGSRSPSGCGGAARNENRAGRAERRGTQKERARRPPAGATQAPARTTTTEPSGEEGGRGDPPSAAGTRRGDGATHPDNRAEPRPTRSARGARPRRSRAGGSNATEYKPGGVRNKGALPHRQLATRMKFGAVTACYAAYCGARSEAERYYRTRSRRVSVG